MNERPDLNLELDSSTFKEYYYLKKEMEDFCRSNGLKVSGSKLELAERIIEFLETGRKDFDISKRPKRKNKSEITLNSIIEDDFICSQQHREFYKKNIGKSFTFNVEFQKWLKNNAGKTYNDSILAYYDILENNKKNKTDIPRQFEYNQYIRDFFKDNVDKSLKDAIECWKYKKSLKGHNKYESGDLIAIAIYGKGGIGKSTTVANIAAAYSRAGKKVMVIGCDPKADTTRTLCGRRISTIIDTLKDNKKPELGDLVYEGFNGIKCVESGGPEPGVGCAGRGVIVAMKRLEQLHAFDEQFDVILYDVLGDVVCGGFSVPLREDYADEVFIVSSGEYMSLYAANNITKGINKLKGNLGGIICNRRGTDNEIEIVESFAEKIGTKVIGIIERSNLIQRSELDAKTVVEYAPDSVEADAYYKLADDIFENENYSIPEPMDNDEFEDFFKSFLD